MEYTAPQQRKISDDDTKNITVAVDMGLDVEVQKIKQAMKNGLPEGNVELAAILGHGPSQTALNRPASHGMNKSELFDFLLFDPNLRIAITIDR